MSQLNLPFPQSMEEKIQDYLKLAECPIQQSIFEETTLLDVCGLYIEHNFKRGQEGMNKNGEAGILYNLVALVYQLAINDIEESNIQTYIDFFAENGKIYRLKESFEPEGFEGLNHIVFYLFRCIFDPSNPTIPEKLSKALDFMCSDEVRKVYSQYDAVNFESRTTRDYKNPGGSFLEIVTKKYLRKGEEEAKKIVAYFGNPKIIELVKDNEIIDETDFGYENYSDIVFSSANIGSPDVENIIKCCGKIKEKMKELNKIFKF